MNKNQVIQRASELADMAPRRGEAERQAADYIQSEIKENVERQEYRVIYPKFEKYELKADGEELSCLPGGLESGNIDNKAVVNSVHNEQGDVNKPCITFNPFAKGISVTTFYQAPCLAVDPSDISKILEAEHIEGELRVTWRTEKSYNILVGNTENPEQVVMTHYDSLWGGFIDNGFSVSLLINLIEEIDLDRKLVVFAGSEELSQEYPYHCYGYRRFESKYNNALDSADEIVVVDSLGRGDQQIVKEGESLEKAIVLSTKKYQKKTVLLASTYGDVLDVYHSPLDEESALNNYEGAKSLLKSKIIEHN